MPGDDVRRLLMLHTRNEYDVKRKSLKKIDKELEAYPRPSTSSSVYSESTVNTDATNDNDSNMLHDGDELEPEDDPASLQTTLASLLPHDQLHEQMRKKKAFYDGWREGPIRFLPTYKYDVGSIGVFDSSEKKRAPSWCDRILYRTRKDRLAYKQKVEVEEQAKKRDEEMKARGLDKTDDVLFDYDPDTDGTYDEFDQQQDTVATEQIVPTREGFEDRIQLEYYTSHQRVLSSDHKPLDAIFVLTYDAVDREVRSRIQAEIAKEMDKDENESRPNVTLVVDHAEVKDGSAEGINFEHVKFDVPITHYITVANTGQVAAKVAFVEELMSGAPPWLDVRFHDEILHSPTTNQEQKLEPGETATIAITIHVTLPSDTRYLNDSSNSLETVLVLRVESGRDHFITIRGTWLTTCFGLSLDQLTRIPESGARTATISSTLLDQDVKWSSPRELFRLTEALEESLERAVAEAGMKDSDIPAPWSSTGWPFVASTCHTPQAELDLQTIAIRDALDTNSSFPSPTIDSDLTQESKVEALAHILLQFLASLDGGIIDAPLWSSILFSLTNYERTRGKAPADPEAIRSLILETMSSSPTRSVAFTFITFMLARVANEVAPVHSTEEQGQKWSSPGKGGAAAAVVLGRARGASEDPKVARRREVEKKFAEVFEKAMFRVEEKAGKEAKREEDKRKQVLGLFMYGRWGE
jgi:phosphatidylinositol-bisphosphatase